MVKNTALEIESATAARCARREVEAALDVGGWRWSHRLSLWVDALLVLEELV
jgi:hypothetical protein